VDFSLNGHCAGASWTATVFVLVIVGIVDEARLDTVPSRNSVFGSISTTLPSFQLMIGRPSQAFSRTTDSNAFCNASSIGVTCRITSSMSILRSNILNCLPKLLITNSIDGGAATIRDDALDCQFSIVEQFPPCCQRLIHIKEIRNPICVPSANRVFRNEMASLGYSFADSTDGRVGVRQYQEKQLKSVSTMYQLFDPARTSCSRVSSRKQSSRVGLPVP